MLTSRKRFRKKIILLLIIAFFHILPVIVSAFYDQATHTKHNVKLGELKYWLWALTWWSTWASFLTIPWTLYKLFALKRKRGSLGEQVWDIVVAETNFLSGVIFCGGGFFLTFRTTIRKPEIVYPLLGNIKTIYIWLFYNFFWHILAPGLTFYYFWKYCQVDKLVKKKTLGLMVNFFNLFVYLSYVVSRPLISKFSKSSSSLPHHYPSDYPYPPFFWIMGKYANNKEQKAGQSRFLFWNWQPSLLTGLIWLAIIIIIGGIMFSLLFHFLVKIKVRKNNKKLAANNEK